MDRLTGMTRTLVVLLILRVIAAPISARPDTFRPTTTDRFYARVCAWPAQKPGRLSSSCVPVPRPGDDGPDVAPGLFPKDRGRAAGPLPRETLSRLTRLTFQDRSPVRLSDRARC